MRLFIDSSVFLKLLLDEPGADKAKEILEMVEESKVLGYITPMVLEEISFKLIFAKASELLDTKNVWRIREALRLDDGVRSKCVELLRSFRNYIEYLLMRGLRVEYVTYDDWLRALNIIEKYGLLPADAIHVAVALRVRASAIATFDEDFKAVKEIRVVP